MKSYYQIVSHHRNAPESPVGGTTTCTSPFEFLFEARAKAKLVQSSERGGFDVIEIYRVHNGLAPHAILAEIYLYGKWYEASYAPSLERNLRGALVLQRIPNRHTPVSEVLETHSFPDMRSLSTLHDHPGWSPKENVGFVTPMRDLYIRSEDSDSPTNKVPVLYSTYSLLPLDRHA